MNMKAFREFEKPDENVLQHARIVWDHLKERSGARLARDTHDKSSPWCMAMNPPRNFFQKLTGRKPARPVIDNALMRRFFWESGLWRFREALISVFADRDLRLASSPFQTTHPIATSVDRFPDAAQRNHRFLLDIIGFLPFTISCTLSLEFPCFTSTSMASHYLNCCRRNIFEFIIFGENKIITPFP